MANPWDNDPIVANPWDNDPVVANPWDNDPIVDEAPTHTMPDG